MFSHVLPSPPSTHTREQKSEESKAIKETQDPKDQQARSRLETQADFYLLQHRTQDGLVARCGLNNYHHGLNTTNLLVYMLGQYTYNATHNVITPNKPIMPSILANPDTK